MENIDFKKKRAQLRLNLFLAMLFLIGSAMFSTIYGVVYLINMWSYNQAIAIASGAGGFILSFLLIGFFGVVYKKLHKKLLEIENKLPIVVDQT